MIKRNFYSGATGVFHNEHNEVLEDYLKGVFRKKEKGIIYKPEPIPKGMTKYNKSLLERVDNCIKVFSSFITVNSCVERLLRQHAQDKNDVAGAIRNIYNMQRAQGGTVRFMRMLKDALKTYQVREQVVYDALKKDLSQTEERIIRNKVFTMDILKDYGLDKIDAFINETKGIDMFEDAIVFMETIRKTKYHVKDFDILDDYYETCEQEYVNYIMDLAEKNNIDILTNISETAQRHIEIRRKKAKEVHEKYVAYQKDTKEKNTMDALNQDNATLFKIIEGTIEDKHVSAILGPRLEILGGECVYLALRKATCIYYVNENHRLTTAKGGILLFAKDNREEIERVKKEVQAEWPNYKVYELLLGLPKMYISDIKDKNVSKRADSLGYTGNSKLLIDDEAVKKEMQDISAGRNYQHKIALEKQLKKYGSLNYIVYYYKNAIRYYSEKNINNKQLGLATFFKPKDTNVEKVKQKIQQQLQLTDNNIKISVLQTDFQALNHEINKMIKQENENNELVKKIMQTIKIGRLSATEQDFRASEPIGKYYIMMLYPGNDVRYVESDYYVKLNGRLRDSDITSEVERCCLFNIKEDADRVALIANKSYTNRLVKVCQFQKD